MRRNTGSGGPQDERPERRRTAHLRRGQPALGHDHEPGQRGRFLQTPWGGRFEHAGYFEEASGRGTRRVVLPSLVLPRYSTFLGREDDDRQIDVSRPLLEEPGTVTAALTNLEEPEYRGTLTLSTYTYTLTSVDLGYMLQTLAILRSEPSDDDLAALENIKASVRGGAEVAVRRPGHRGCLYFE